MAHQYIFVMKDLKKIVPPKREILKGIWLSFYPGAKIGVIGGNGAGKSTLLRIMAGVDKEFLGEAWPADGVRVGYLPQEPQLDPTKDARGNVEDGVGEVRSLLTRFDEINARLGEPLGDDEMEKVLAEQARVQDAIEAANGWDLDRTVEIAMDALRCPLGDLVVQTEHLVKGYGDRLLIEDLTFSLPRGGIVGVIGANGAGKTTLFRMITGQEKPDRGALQVGDLSGGERNRVHLATMLKSGGNLLLLDEPTNDLDVDTLRALEDALLSFPGCAAIISHDRWFLDRVATHVLAFEGDSQTTWFEGGFDEYEAWVRETRGPEAL